MALSVIFSYSVVAMAVAVEPESQKQIGKYFEANDTTGALATSTSLEAGYTQQSYANGQVLVNKTIAGTDTENVFDVTLEVITKNRIENQNITEDAAVVLVIDVSGSMNYKRLSSAKKAAQSFINTFGAGEEGSKHKIAIVKFSGTATTVQSWTSAANLVTNNSNTQCKAISNLSAGGGTNLESSLVLANNLLGTSSVSNISNKNIIVLTDGEPTYGLSSRSIEDGTKSVGKIGNIIGDGFEGNSDTHKIHTNVESFSETLINSGVSLYGIFVGADKINCYRGCPVNGMAGKTWLSTKCGFTSYSTSDTDLDKLSSIFDSISELIKLQAEAWILTDPMGDYVDFIDYNGTVQKDGLNYLKSEDTISWNLRQATPEYNKDDETYTYNLSYRIKLDTLKSGYQAGTEYATNKTTSLTYIIKNDATKEVKAGTAYFNVPSVKGFAGNLSFTKVNELEKPMTGVTFTLTAKDDSSFVRTATSSVEEKDGDNVVVSAGTVSFENIPSGHEYVLHEVAAPANYVAAADKNVTVSYGNVSAPIDDGKIENVPDTTDITVRKVWSDGDNQDNKRLDSIQVQLYANGKETGAPVELNAGNSWSHTFTNLPKAADGQAIKYTVDEVTVLPEGYTKSVDGFIITNSYTPETTTVSGHKTWVGDESKEVVEEVPSDDNKDAGGATVPETRTVVNPSRPSSITVNLLADGKKIDDETVTAEDNWSWSFTNLPVYNNGKKIVYTVTEDTVKDYVTSIYGYNITNTYSPNKTSVTVNKEWKDNGNQDGIRPDSITVKLFADGVDTNKTVELNKDNNWQATFADLDARTEESKAETTISYTVEEVSIEGYDSSISPVSGGFTITNTHTPATTEVKVSKTWDDNDNEANARPNSVTVRLLADGVETGKTVTLTEGNGWTDSFTGLAKNANGKEIAYTVAENAVTDYTMTGNTFEKEEGVFVITNKYTPDTKNITVKKVWNDAENKDNIRPDKITVSIKNGEETVATRDITAKDGWTYTFENLLKREAGKEITYKVEESPVEGYTSSVSVDTNGDFIITNTHTPEEKPPVTPIIPPFTPESVYTVTYMDGVDDEVVFEDQSTTNLKKGDKTPAFNGEPVREGYKFIGWSPVVAETVTGDAVYYAQWEKLPEEPSVVDPSGDNDPIDDGKDIDAQPNGDADTEAKGVKTGDETMLAMWGALGLIAALGLGGTLVIGRRREE